MAVVNDLEKGKYQLVDLNTEDVGDWEPSYDTTLWQKKRVLNLFIQKVKQIDGEGKASVGTSPVQVLEWKPVL
ncbi:hypothetical protein [Pedobacter sp. MW01-1-1]|uniref:hypothetical protein n=1 Tax=Pedobacter sp. MW01-1-1 TaxID=3383027 RepID=UPI003FED5A37